jgi:hypothetical protein
MLTACIVIFELFLMTHLQTQIFMHRYEQKRILRTKIVHGVTRMASKSLSGYPSFAMAVGFPHYNLFNFVFCFTKLYIWLSLMKFVLQKISFQVTEFLLRLILPHFMTWLLTARWLVKVYIVIVLVHS